MNIPTNLPEGSDQRKTGLPQTLTDFAEYYDVLAKQIRGKSLTAMGQDERDLFLID